MKRVRSAICSLLAASFLLVGGAAGLASGIVAAAAAPGASTGAPSQGPDNLIW